MANNQRISITSASQRLLQGDNVALLRQHINDASIDLIYADPPFNSGHAYYATGKRHEGPRFKDAWKFDPAPYQAALEQSHPQLRSALGALRTIIGECDVLAYCAALGSCLSELYRVLKQSGSIYLHCDAKMSAYLRLMLDALFGREHFRNEIIWAYRTGGAGKRGFARKHDTILFYSKSASYTFHPQIERVRYGKRFFGAQKDEHGFYADVLMRDVWDIPAVINVSAERTGYPTQKPLTLLERIIRTSSNAGEVVLDPFCGSGTALLAAQHLGRHWVGMDISEAALTTAQARLTSRA